MTFLPHASVALIVLILICLLRARRKAAGSSSNVTKSEPSNEARNAARRKIVADADRLCSLDDEIARLAEGTGSGVSDDLALDRAERVRAEAARLRATLEAACAQYKLPIRLALGRRRRAPSLPSARPTSQ